MSYLKRNEFNFQYFQFSINSIFFLIFLTFEKMIEPIATSFSWTLLLPSARQKDFIWKFLQKDSYVHFLTKFLRGGQYSRGVNNGALKVPSLAFVWIWKYSRLDKLRYIITLGSRSKFRFILPMVFKYTPTLNLNISYYQELIILSNAFSYANLPRFK